MKHTISNNNSGRCPPKINVMKKALLIILFLFIPKSHCIGQGLPVYDNTNFLTLGKQIIEAAKQTGELLKTVEFLREQKERIEQVSNVVKQLKAVRDITMNNEQLFTIVRDDLRSILDSPYITAEEVGRVSDSFNAIIENAIDDFDFVSAILTSSHLKMTDAERAAMLQEREQQSKEMLVEVKNKTKRYREIISFREMQDKINHRAINY